MVSIDDDIDFNQFFDVKSDLTSASEFESASIVYIYEPLIEEYIAHSLKEKFSKIKGIGWISFYISEVIYPLWCKFKQAIQKSCIDTWRTEYFDLFDERYFILISTLNEIPIEIDLLLMFVAYKKSKLKDKDFYINLSLDTLYDDIFQNINKSYPKIISDKNANVMECLGMRGFIEQLDMN